MSISNTYTTNLANSNGHVTNDVLSIRTVLMIATRYAGYLAVIIVFGVLAWLIWDLIQLGWSALSWDFIISEPSRAGRSGGIAPMLVASAWIVGLSIIFFLPVGLGAAVLISEKLPPSTTLGRWLRQVLNILAGVPSVVFGLFGNAFFCITLGMGFSILAGALTLACMVLPYFVRTVEAGFTQIPASSRRSAQALGYSQWGTLRHVLLPAAVPAIVLGAVLGIARAAAETAALIVTSGSIDRMPSSALDSGRAITVHIYELVTKTHGGEANAGGAALVLLLLLLVINLGALGISRWLQPHRQTAQSLD